MDWLFTPEGSLGSLLIASFLACIVIWQALGRLARYWLVAQGATF